MLDKYVSARVNALANLRERFGDNLVDRFVDQFEFDLEEHCTNEDEGSVFRCLSEDDHELLNGIRDIRDGYTGWYWNNSVGRFAHYCKDEILTELKKFADEIGHTVGQLLEQLCDNDVVLWLIEDCLDNDFGDVDGTDKHVSSCLGYWVGQELVWAYQEYYYEEINNG